MLKAVPGLELARCPITTQDSLCCGGGGGRIWMETPKGERFSDLRVEQAKAGAASAGHRLPLLHHQLRGQQAESGMEDTLEIKDITEDYPGSYIGKFNQEPKEGYSGWKKNLLEVQVPVDNAMAAKGNFGDVMVVGGGISGIQASLDLATAGFKVYLVEKGPSHRRPHGPAGQDLSHQRLLHVNTFAQTGRGRPASEHRGSDLHRSRKGGGARQGDFKVNLVKKPATSMRTSARAVPPAWSTARWSTLMSSTRKFPTTRRCTYSSPRRSRLVAYIDESCLYLKEKKCLICEGVCQERRH
jgi:hypothetical protein